MKIKIEDRYDDSDVLQVNPLDILTALGRGVEDYKWTVTGVDGDDEKFDIVGNFSDSLSGIKRRDAFISTNELVNYLLLGGQVIWGEFRGYNNTESEPIIMIQFIDSSFVNFVSADSEHLNLVDKRFLQTSISEP